MKLEKDRDVLSLKGVSVRYGDSTVALHPTSLDVKQGEFLVLLGASGAGKSTLLRSINGLVLPTKGEVSIPGLAGWGSQRKDAERSPTAHREAETAKAHRG